MNLSFRLSNSWVRFRDSSADNFARGGRSILISLMSFSLFAIYFPILPDVPLRDSSTYEVREPNTVERSVQRRDRNERGTTSPRASSICWNT